MKTTRLKEAAFMIATAIIFTFGIQTVFADDLQQQTKDIKKNIAKEVKRLEKEGYVVQNGKLSLEKQLEDLWLKQAELDNQGVPVYYIITQKLTGENVSMASTKAHGLANEQLADQIQAGILKMVDDKAGKMELKPENVSKVINLVNANRYIIVATLGQVLPVVQMYRSLPDKTVEVTLSFAYNKRAMNNAAIRAIRDNIGDRSSELIVALDKLIK